MVTSIADIANDIGTKNETLETDDKLAMYRRMVLIRRFETRASQLYRDSELPGFLHLSIGQEASAVGACWNLSDSDVITSTHRGHGHVLAKGLEPGPMFAELMGKATGTCSGRGGSMHIADPSKGVFGANGIVAAGLPIAVGAATAAQLREDGDVALSFFGDGAISQGMFHEALNLAAAWELPIVFFCENNHYAEFSTESKQHRASLKERAEGYGVGYVHVDGNDVIAVANRTGAVIDEIRAGRGPVIIEAETYRWHGHYEGDPQSYRSSEELDEWKQHDPLSIMRAHLSGQGVDDATLSALEKEVADGIETDIEQARKDPYPEPESLYDHVYAPRPELGEPEAEEGKTFKTMHAIKEALQYEMTRDKGVFLAGIDVAQGNVYALFRGLPDQFPGRVRDTPISESAIIGAAVGSAMAGMKPVVEIMYFDFIGVALDGIMNQAAKMPFMTGGNATMPLVIRTQFGAGRSSGSQHSQSLEALLAAIPGLTVVMPSNPVDYYGLLRASIQDPNPVIFVENRLQYGMKGPRPQEDFIVPLGKAKVTRPGTDVTIVTWSRMWQESTKAAETLAEEGIDAEVIDLRTVAPFDRDTILESLKRTHRLVVAHEAVQDFGVGAEIAAMAANEGFWDLDAPVARIGAKPMPAPYSPGLERIWLPDAEDIADTVRRVVRS